MIQDKHEKVVVVGAGQGGGSVVAFLRQYGYCGDITLIGEEPVAPYHRPPLSKEWLKGDFSCETLELKPASFYAKQKIALRLGTRVARIDASRGCVILADGDEMGYDHLILATGADARTLPMQGAGFDNVMTLRTMNDAQRLRAALVPGKKLVIIGGGYVGLECAATARTLGVDVVVIERAGRLLERVASPHVSSFLAQFHQNHSVLVETNADLLAIDGSTRAESVQLADGRRFDCDSLLVGIGASPAIAIAAEAGLACDDGILVDADCHTSNPHIFALGDVARRPHALYHCRLRLESVPSAMEQAKRIAAVLTGRKPAEAEVPWFWSEQYNLKLQIAGLLFESKKTIVRGDPDQSKFAVYHLCDGRVVAVETINAPSEFFAGKKLIGSKKTVDSERLADLSVSLHELVA
ncbi:NAD(P)/FAD-dependent oxidoreductase [Rhodoferax ferrireducens]|uniref:NAD(P)/FAD-dependent oxidoreductase n=1 Tax=Rhodoferax ferrireducens TaxID=192843 RepID=UPI000E0D3A97|nr:FAD-dependent oxidoreductase [Rhodoferax ferrireducens]